METPTDEAGAGGQVHDFTRVRAVVSSLERAIRSHRLHEGQGPTLDEHVGAAAQQLDDLLESGDLTLRVSSFGLLFGNKPLTGARGVDETWFGLFADSVRDLCFQPGLSAAELRIFIEVLCSEPAEGDDRVTLLWRREIHHIELFLATLVPTRLEAGADGDVRLVAEAGAASLFDPAEGEPGTPALAFSQGDPRALVGATGLSWIGRVESPLFEPEPWVEAASQAGGARARGQDARRFAAALRSASASLPAGAEVPVLLDAVLDALLVRDPEAQLVPLLAALLEHESASAAPILARLAQPEFMVRLAPLCDLDAQGLDPVVSALGKVDPDGLSALLVELRNPDAQKRFAQLAGESGGDVVPFYLTQLDSEDEREALSAVSALAALGRERALPGLAKAMNSSSDRVRYQALRSLDGQYHPDMAEALMAALDDPRRVQRLLALRVLEQCDEQRVAAAVTEIVMRSDFLERDPEERGKWMHALGSFPATETLAAFAHLLGLRSALRKDVAQLQLLAIAGLQATPQPRARQLLADSKGNWQLARAVRKAIAAALEGSGT